MKKIHFILTIFILLQIRLLSQTTVPSGNISGIWTKTGSPYKVQGDLTEPKRTLTIEPGVVVEFQNRYTVFVDGLDALMTTNILFS